MTSFAKHVREQLGLKTFVPSRGDEFDLDAHPKPEGHPEPLAEPVENLVNEMASLYEGTSNLSDHLDRFGDLIAARIVEIDKPTEEKLRTICKSLGDSSKSVIEILDSLDVELED